MSPFWIAKETLEPVGERGRIVGGHQDPCFAVVNELSNALQAAGDHG